jgi:hypothetical protein
MKPRKHETPNVGLVFTALATAATVIVCADGRPAASPIAVAVGVEGRTNANVSIDARRDLVALAWSATRSGSTDVYAAVSRDGGRTFAAPVRVNDVPGAVNVGGEQPPRVAIVEHDGPSWFDVMWTARRGEGAPELAKTDAGTRLMTARSVDGGRTFAKAAVVPGSDAKGNRGWESMVSTAPGQVFRIWLDHRELAEQAGATSMHHDGQAHTGHGDTDGVARAQLSKLYFSGPYDLTDSGAKGRSIASGVCYCCKTALATGADGVIYAAWRHVYPGNVRDIAFTLSRDSGRTFAAPMRVSNDDWVLDGCPENGPSIAADVSGTVHIVWPTLVKGNGSEPALALFYATTRDGKTFTPRKKIPSDGTPRHPQVVVNREGRVAVAWDEQLTGSRRVVVDELKTSDGSPRFSRLALVDGERNDYPAVAGTEHGFALAYTSATKTDSTIRVIRVGER